MQGYAGGKATSQYLAQRVQGASPELLVAMLLEGGQRFINLAVNAMKITSDAKQSWLLRFSPETRVEIKGKSSADMLGHGTYVAFTAEVNKKTARIEEKVGKLAVFIPSNRMQVGAVPEGGMTPCSTSRDRGARGRPSGVAAWAVGFGAGGATISRPVSSASHRAATATMPMITTKRWMRS